MSRSISVALHLCFLVVAASQVSTARAAARPPPDVKGVVNLNAATEKQLRLLPGVGAKKAARIIEQRKHQKFQSTDQLMKVKGFGRMTYRKLKPHLAVEGPTTISRASAARGSSPRKNAPADAQGPAAPASAAPAPDRPVPAEEPADHAG
jgi:competence protein ComEA